MNSSPKFSVIVPSHNGAERIATALESLRRQTSQNFETIVVCDACEDNTHGIAEAYGARTFDCDFRRDGLTRNIGIDNALGQYILFLDDDDWFLHEFVFQMLDCVVGRSNEDLFSFSVIMRNVGYMKQTDHSVLKMAASHVWKRSFVGDTRFDNAQYSSDSHFIDALIQKHPRSVWWDMPMYYYNYMRKNSLSDRHRKGEI